MYNVIKRSRVFNTEMTTDMEEMESVLNNPLCTITRKSYEKVEDKSFTNGKISNITQKLLCIMEWDEKVILV